MIFLIHFLSMNYEKKKNFQLKYFEVDKFRFFVLVKNFLVFEACIFL